jgi:hypothetical protein
MEMESTTEKTELEIVKEKLEKELIARGQLCANAINQSTANILAQFKCEIVDNNIVAKNL